jgi:hypothetical protein
MKKEYIDFDLDDIEVTMALEVNRKIWIDADGETVGRCYCINYITAPNILDLLSTTVEINFF